MQYLLLINIDPELIQALPATEALAEELKAARSDEQRGSPR